LCERIAVLRQGELVEQGATAEVFEHPRHEYTRALLDARPMWRMPSACRVHNPVNA
jgi:ABC-type dipeptide/oligopeptide/nickel transport system ATPase component